MVMTRCRAGWREGYGESATPAPGVERVCVDIEEDGIMILFVLRTLSTSSTDTAPLGGNILPRRAEREAHTYKVIHDKCNLQNKGREILQTVGT
jgi:hypothetical protein